MKLGFNNFWDVVESARPPITCPFVIIREIEQFRIRNRMNSDAIYDMLAQSKSTV